MKRLLATLIAACVIVLVALSPTAAYATVIEGSSPLVSADNAPAVLSIAFAPTWVQLVTLVVTVLLPVLVGLVTTRETNPARKAVYLAVLSAVTGFGSQLLDALASGQTYDAAGGLYTAVVALVVAIALHYGIWKPTGVSVAAQRFGSGGEHVAS